MSGYDEDIGLEDGEPVDELEARYWAEPIAFDSDIVNARFELARREAEAQREQERQVREVEQIQVAQNEAWSAQEAKSSGTSIGIR